MSTTDDLDNDDSYVTPQTRSLITETTTVGKATTGDTTKYATAYSFTSNGPVYNGGGYVWEISYNSISKLYTYTAHSGSITGTVIASYGTLEAANIIGAKSITINAGVSIDNVVMTSTGAIFVAAGSTVTNSVLATSVGVTGQITGGGTISNSYIYAPKCTISSGGVSTNNVYLYGGQTVNYSFTSSTNQTSSSTDSVTVYTGYTEVITVAAGGSFDINSNYWGKNMVTFQPNSYNCFLAGSIIETTNGLVAIEDIKIGDQIVTYHHGQRQTKAVIWTGYNHAHITPLLSDDLAGYPVRIMKNAIAENVPSKDLLLTSEHCIVLNNQFVPVRMLVNNASIVYDYTITEYTFYHIETEEHSIISANNLLTESYLDTGNRSSFISNHNIVDITNKQKQWNLDSAAPITTSREIVEPLFMQLKERAKELGYQSTQDNALTTNECGLHLLTNSGEILEATYKNQNRFVFKIPENTTQIQLISHSNQPNQSIGPFVDDRRQLGILVGEITLLESKRTSAITEHLTSTDLEGWHPKESNDCRWTNGHASLTIKQNSSEKTCMLIIHVLAAGPYKIENIDIQKLAV